MMKAMAVMTAISVISISRSKNMMKARIREAGKTCPLVVWTETGIDEYCWLFFWFIIFPFCSV